MIFSDLDADQKLVRNLSPAFGVQKKTLLASSDSSLHVVEEVERSADGEIEIAWEEEPRNGAGDAFIAPGIGRGDGRTQNGSNENGGGRVRNGRSNRRNETRRH